MVRNTKVIDSKPVYCKSSLWIYNKYNTLKCKNMMFMINFTDYISYKASCTVWIMLHVHRPYWIFFHWIKLICLSRYIHIFICDFNQWGFGWLTFSSVCGGAWENHASKYCNSIYLKLLETSYNIKYFLKDHLLYVLLYLYIILYVIYFHYIWYIYIDFHDVCVPPTSYMKLLLAKIFNFVDLLAFSM